MRMLIEEPPNPFDGKSYHLGIRRAELAAMFTVKIPPVPFAVHQREIFGVSGAEFFRRTDLTKRMAAGIIHTAAKFVSLTP